jgi:dethiobiotin synthetase
VNYLVTGTDTGVGKTYVTARLIRTLRAHRLDCVGMKPWCSGSRSDVVELRQASDFVEPEHLVNPTYFQVPAAPYTAAMIEDRPINLEQAARAYRSLSSRHDIVLVEGAGGLLVPILQDYDFCDLAQDWQLTVIVVAANRLGCLNHCRLTIEALQNRGLSCCGLLLNNLDKGDTPAQLTNQSVLELVLNRPICPINFEESDFTDVAKQLGFLQAHT